MSLSELVRRRSGGHYVVDPWGVDHDVHRAALALGRLRWRVTVVGEDHIPRRGPALLVIQRHLGLSETSVVGVGVGSVTGRRLRLVGAPDLPLIEPGFRRLGMALADPAEIRGLLRDGHVVGLGLGARPLGGGPGEVDLDMVRPAVDLGVALVPVATRGHEWGRSWTVTVGPPVVVPATTVDEAGLEVAEALRAAVAGLAGTGPDHLDEPTGDEE